VSCNVLPHADPRTVSLRPRSSSALKVGLTLLCVMTILSPVLVVAEDTVPSRQDSLRQSIVSRLQRISVLKDSLSSHEDVEFDATLEDLGDVFREIEQQLRDIDVTVDDEMLKFSSPEGELSFDIPEDWGEKVSQGLSAITATILSELPDTLDIEHGLSEFRAHAESWNINIFDEEPDKPPKLKIVGSEIFSTGDDVVVAVNERITGNVVVIGADATILGRVDESVVVIGGALNLDEDARVHGDAISLFGSLRRHDDSVVDGTVVSVGGSGLAGDFFGLPDLTGGVTGSLIKLTGLLLLGLLILMVFALLPKERLFATESYLVHSPGRSFAAGLFWATIGHVLLVLALALLIVTVIGIPVAALLGLAYLILGVVSVGIVARVLGARICQRPSCQEGPTWWTLLIGLFVILVPGLLGILFGGLNGLRPLARLFDVIGLTVHLTVYCFGAGAVLSSRFGTARNKSD